MRDIPLGRTLPDRLVIYSIFACGLILGAHWLG